MLLFNARQEFEATERGLISKHLMLLFNTPVQGETSGYDHFKTSHVIV